LAPGEEGSWKGQGEGLAGCFRESQVSGAESAGDGEEALEDVAGFELERNM